MYILIYQEIENNAISYQKATRYSDWKEAMRIMHRDYEEKVQDLQPKWYAKYNVSCTIKDGGMTYDWSLLML